MKVIQFCWKCSIQEHTETTQTVLEKEDKPNNKILIRAVCTICGCVNTIIRRKNEKE